MDDQELEKLLEDNPELANNLHTCLTDGQIKKILTNQASIETRLGEGEKLFKALMESLERIFKLYEQHESEIESLKKFRNGKEAVNGSTGDTISEMKKKDDDLDKQIKEVNKQIGDINTNIAIIMEWLTTQKEKETRDWSFKDKVFGGLLVTILGGLIIYFILWLIKTFKWGI